MDVTAIIAAATAANATVIGQATATGQFSDGVKFAKVCKRLLPHECFLWMKQRANGTVMNAVANNSKKPGSSKDTCSQMDEFCVQDFDSQYFVLVHEPIPGSADTNKFLKLDGDYAVPTLFLGATLPIIKKYYADVNISFWVDKINENEIPELDRFMSKYTRNRGLLFTDLKTSKNVVDRIYVGDDDRLAGKFFVQFLAQNYSYNVSEDTLAELAERFKAKRMFQTMFLPPDVLFGEMPENPVYGLRKVPASIDVSPDSSQILLEYECAMKAFAECWHKNEQTYQYLYYFSDGELIANATEVPTNHVLYKNPVNLERLRELDPLLGGYAIKLSKLIKKTMEVYKPLPLWKRFKDAACNLITDMFYGRAPKNLHLFFRTKNTTHSRGHINNKHTWSLYYQPAFVGTDRTTGQSVNMSLWIKSQFVYHVVQEIYFHHEKGDAISTYELHKNDRFCEVMDLNRSLGIASITVRRKLKYFKMPEAVCHSLRDYMMSLDQKVLASADVFIPQAMSWFRRKLFTVSTSAGAEGVAAEIYPLDKLIMVANSMYLQVLDELGHLQEFRHATLGSPVWWNKIKSRVLSLFEDTVIEDFANWLKRNRWWKKFVIFVPAVKHFRVQLKACPPIRLLTVNDYAIFDNIKNVKWQDQFKPKEFAVEGIPHLEIEDVKEEDEETSDAGSSEPSESEGSNKETEKVPVMIEVDEEGEKTVIVRDLITESEDDDEDYTSTWSSDSEESSSDPPLKWKRKETVVANALTTVPTKLKHKNWASESISNEIVPPLTKEDDDLVDAAIKKVHSMDIVKNMKEYPCECIVCASLGLSGVPFETVVIDHQPLFVNVKLSREDLSLFIDGLADDKNPNTGALLDLDRKVVQRFKVYKDAGIDLKIKLRFIRGVPGSGKSYTLRVIAQQMRKLGVVASHETIGLYSPFNKLANEYAWEAIGLDGKPIGPLFEFKTTHRGVLEFSGKRVIMIEEFGAVDFQMFALLAVANPDALFIACGDENQTQVLAGEGINIFYGFESSGSPLKDWDKHTLRLNRRNPKNHVLAANNFLPPETQMIPFRQDVVPFRIFPTLEDVTKAIPNWQSEYIVMSFSDAAYLLVRGEKFIGNCNSVRKNQGSTLQKVLIPLTKNDLSLMSDTRTSLVALTRAKVDLIFYVPVNHLAISAWLGKIGAVRFSETMGDQPTVSYVPKDTFKPQTVMEPKLPPTGVYEAMVAMMEVENLATESDFDKSELFNAVPAEATKEVKAYRITPDAHAALTKSGVPKTYEREYKQIMWHSKAMPQLATDAFIQKSALIRQNRKLNNKVMNNDNARYWRSLIDRFITTYKTHEGLTLEEKWVTILEFYEDAIKRNYFARLDSVNPENAEPDMLGLDVQVKSDYSALKARFDGIKQRLNVKSQIKVNNMSKEDDPFAAGQTIATMPTWRIARWSIAQRLFEKLEAKSNKTMSRENKNVLITRTHKSDEAFIEETSATLASYFGNNKIQGAYTDGAKTDSGMTIASVEVLALYMLQLAIWTNWVEIIPQIRELLVISRNCTAEAAGLVFKTLDSTPSGDVNTFWCAMRYCSLCTFAKLTATGPSVQLEGGDDGAMLAFHLEENFEGARQVLEISNVEVRVVLFQGGPMTLDFTGFLICSSVKGSSASLHIVYNLVRKYLKITSMLFKDKHHYGEVMIEVRHWLSKYRSEDLYDTLIWANALLIQENDAVTYHTAVKTAENMFATLQSLSHSSADDILSLSKLRVRMVDPRVVKTGEGVNTRYGLL